MQAWVPESQIPREPGAISRIIKAAFAGEAPKTTDSVTLDKARKWDALSDLFVAHLEDFGKEMEKEVLKILGVEEDGP